MSLECKLLIASLIDFKRGGRVIRYYILKMTVKFGTLTNTMK